MVKISIQNITDHDIRLAGESELGTIQSIESVLPTEVSQGATTAMISEVQKTTNANESNSEEQCITPSVLLQYCVPSLNQMFYTHLWSSHPLVHLGQLQNICHK